MFHSVPGVPRENGTLAPGGEDYPVKESQNNKVVRFHPLYLFSHLFLGCNLARIQLPPTGSSSFLINGVVHIYAFQFGHIAAVFSAIVLRGKAGYLFKYFAKCLDIVIAGIIHQDIDILRAFFQRLFRGFYLNTL